MVTDRERAEQYVEELYGVTINKKTGQTRAGVRREYWVELFEHIVAAVRKERDAEWKNVAREAIPLIEGRLEIAKKENDLYLVKWATDTRDALNALIEEVNDE